MKYLMLAITYYPYYSFGRISGMHPPSMKTFGKPISSACSNLSQLILHFKFSDSTFDVQHLSFDLMFPGLSRTYARLKSPRLKKVIVNFDLPISQDSIEDKSKAFIAEMLGLEVDAVEEDALYPGSMGQLMFEAILLN